jgi:acylphosphatase
VDEKRVLVTISGWVQGVGFRAACQQQARRLGLAGWVRNQSDGSVEALFEGPVAAVDEMLAWCQHGPANAEVTNVSMRDAEPGPRLRAFNIRM